MLFFAETLFQVFDLTILAESTLALSHFQVKGAIIRAILVEDAKNDIHLYVKIHLLIEERRMLLAFNLLVDLIFVFLAAKYKKRFS